MPTDVSAKQTDDSLSHGKDTLATPEPDLVGEVSVILRELANYSETAISGFHNDLKLAITSLIILFASILASIIVALSLWLLMLYSIYLLLMTLHVHIALVIITLGLLQVLILLVCKQVHNRMLANLEFNATKASLLAKFNNGADLCDN